MRFINWHEARRFLGMSNQELVAEIRAERLPAYWYQGKRLNPKRKRFTFLDVVFEQADVESYLEVR